MESSDCKVRNVYENKNEKNPQQYSPKRARQKLKCNVWVQYQNQDLNSAIQQMKQQYKSTSFHKDLNQIQKKYQTVTNPPSKKQPFPFQNLPLFTDTYRKKYQQRLQQIKERRIQIEVRSIEKQMQAKIAKKRKENKQLKKRMQSLKDINQKHQQSIRMKKILQKRKQQQQQFIHSGYEDMFKMMRKTKQKVHQNQLKQSRTIQQQSWKEMKFKDYIQAVEKKERNFLNEARLEFLRSKSSKKFRTKKIPNNIQIQRKQLRSASNYRKQKEQ